MAPHEVPTVRVCPNCGFSHLQSSRPHTWLERAQEWCTRTKWFRCHTCKWRGRLRDVWDADGAFPDLPPMRLGRELSVEMLQQRDEESLVELVLTRKADLQGLLKIWLDDSRLAPPGWLRVTTAASAQKLLEAEVVAEISLDYDLGWCADCLEHGEHLKHSGRRHCPHMPTGYDLVSWMSETNRWPRYPPIVHSGNLEGGARMLGMIARQWQEPAAAADRPIAAALSAPPGPTFAAATGVLESSIVTTLTTCPHCGRPNLYRTHRRSNFERAWSLVTRRYPVRCEACGWTNWSKSPILVRVSPGADVPTARIDAARFEKIDPD